MGLVADITLVVAVALAGGLVAQRLRQPPIVGYILAGIVVGPFTGGLTVVHIEGIEQLAELGVALLLFALGVEVSFRELAPVRAVAIGGAAIQVVLTIGLGAALATALGWAWQPALWFGSLISLSSTMVALKTIQAQGRLGTLSSRVMLGMLVVQDLAVVPLMIVLPELSNPAGGATRVLLASARAALLLGLTVLVATRAIPRLMAAVARWNSRELFLLATTAIALGVGYAAWSFGLSLALGAFVAGLVISESEYAHQALSDVMPLRDLFGTLFFVSVGMLMDPAFLWHNAGSIALVIVAVAAGKAAIFAAVVRLFGYRRVVPLAAGLTLFQVGEFAFVLARVGVETGSISRDVYALVLNTAVATMALTPVVSALTPVVYARFTRRNPQEPVEILNLPNAGLADHVVIAGAGRVGRTIADALAEAGLPFVVIELDDRRVQDARAAGLPIIYGDASHPVVLEAAHLRSARAVVVTVPTYADVRHVIDSCRRLRAGIAIVARADGPDAMRALVALGVEDVMSPETEAAIGMTRAALAHLGVSVDDAQRLTAAIRRARYQSPAESSDPEGP